jgi:hypothetical protein
MSFENRANWIFLAIFVAVSAPGAVILFRKKLDPDARIMYLPDPVARETAFMNADAPPRFSRVAPPKTMDWLKRLMSERSMQPSALLADPSTDLPVMSTDGRVQLLAVDGAKAYLLLWQDGAGDVTVDEVQQVGVERIEVPRQVHLELRNHNVLVPPHHVTWITVSGDLAGPLPRKLTVRWDAGKPMSDRLNLP